jgi:2-amino-4-hydroxy-6-hydroxymethyldihydropteridine diphosphokinase
MSPSSLAFIALGSNVGNSCQTVLRVMARLQELSAKPLLKSSLWETEPVGCPPGSPPFVNAVVALEPQPGETAESLLKKLNELEIEFGRSRTGVRNAPRPLDLDLIAFGAELRTRPDLILPHPRAHERRFVLAPFAEIFPGYILPGRVESVLDLLNKLPPEPRVKRLGAAD